MSTYSHISLCEAAAVFTATLAFPVNEEKAHRLTAYLAHEVVEQIAASQKDSDPELQRFRESFSQINRSGGKALFKRAAEIISSKRLIAAKMAYPQFRAACGDQFGLPPHNDVRTYCSNDMIADVSSDLTHPNRQRDTRGRKPQGGEADCNKANIHERIWKPTLPVLHMALALHVETILACCEGFDAIDLLSDPDLSERLILKSRTYAHVVSFVFDITKQRILVPFLAS